MRTILLLAAIALLPAVASAQEPADITPDQAQAELMRRWRQAAPQGPCLANPRYLVVTVLSGTAYAEKRAPLDVQTGPYLLDLCEVIYMVHDKNGAKLTIHDGSPLAQSFHVLIVEETLDELCRAMGNCVVAGGDNTVEYDAVLPK